MNLGEFEQWRQKFRAETDAATIRLGILGIIHKPTGLADLYRINPEHYPIEEDIGDRLHHFRHCDAELRMIRKFFLRRYAFARVREAQNQMERPSRLWWLNCLLPRVGLAQILGLGVVLGASGVFSGLEEIAKSGYFRWFVAAACLALVFGLVRLHVRDRIGGPKDRLRNRTSAVFGICMMWPAAAMLLEWLTTLAMHDAHWCFKLWRAFLVNCAALVFAMLSQFFFAKDATIGDPL